MVRLRSIAFLVLASALDVGPATAQTLSFSGTIPAGSDDGGIWGPILGVPINGWNRTFRCTSDPGQEKPDFKAVKDLCPPNSPGCHPCVTFSYDVPFGPTSQILDFKFELTYAGSMFTSKFALVPHGQPIMPADLKDTSDATVEFLVPPDKIVVTGAHHTLPEECPLSGSVQGVPALGTRYGVGLGLVLAAAGILLIVLRPRGV